MSKNRPLSEVQILNGTHEIATKSGGKGFGAGSIVGVNATAETITINPAATPDVVVVEKQSEAPAAPALTAEEIKEMIAAAATEITNQAEIQRKQVEEAAAVAIAEAKQSAEAALKEAEAKSQAEVDRLNNELIEARKGATALADLGKLTGNSEMTQQPQSLEVLGTGSQEMRNWQRLLNQAPVRTVSHNGHQFAQKDTRSADEYLVKNRNAIRDGVEAELREAGCLQGSVIGATNAPTVMADIPSTAFNYLSDVIRRVNDSDLIYTQFARSYSVPGVAPRFEGQVPRYPYNPGPTAIADRELTPGTDINTNTQRVVEDMAPVRMKELGLGKDTNNSAIGVATFVNSYSMTDLVQVIETNLGRDYAQTKDLYLRTIWMGATTTLYNNNGRVTTTATDVVTGGDGGRISRAFLRNLRSQLRIWKVPTFRNGLYILSLTPTQLEVLVAELVALNQRIDPTNAEEEMVSRIFALQNGTEYGGEVSGFRLVCDGFMVFEQNTHSVGAVGTEGVQAQTLGGALTNITTETSFAAGADTMCWATALPVEIREDDYTDFGRRNRWIWYSHENAAGLDVNEVTVAGRITQERRVVKLNFTRVRV